LDGKDLFQDPYSHSGCCTLKIEPSSTPAPLKVKNDSQSRDFTSPFLNSSPLSSSSSSSPSAYFNPMASFGLQSSSPLQSSTTQLSKGKQVHPLNSSGGSGCVLLVNKLSETKITPDALFTLFGG
jgi:hypothetical protein